MSLSQSLNPTGLDSAFTKKLRMFIDEYYFLDSAYSSSLRELKISDSIITILKIDLKDCQRMNLNNEIDKQVLRKTVMDLQHDLDSGLKWWHYGIGGTLLVIIGVLAGMQI